MQLASDVGWNGSNMGSNPHADTPHSDRDQDQDRILINLPTDSDDSVDFDEETDGDQYAPQPSSAPIEAGEPNLENAIFVALGAIAMIPAIVRVVSISM